jgi:peptide/nickel transport system ATP-binding protein
MGPASGRPDDIGAVDMDGPARVATTSASSILEVRNLRVQFPTDDGLVNAVDDVSFSIGRNEVLGIVGESGSGKTVTSMSILGLLPKSAKISGEIVFNGQNLLALGEKEMQPLRGNRVAMVFQDALTALNPVYSVGYQISEAIAVHNDWSKEQVRKRALELLDLVGIPNPTQRIDQYPHEYSGGMRQRAMIAMSIANEPDLLIADEPTTALDVTIQAQVLEVLERVQDRTSSSILLITHDLGVVAGMADRVMVMYAGRQAEIGTVDEIFYDSRHPYTLGLLASLPRIDAGEKADRLYRIQGQPPSLIHVPSGCPFHPRCFYRRLPDPCATERPAFAPVAGDSDHRAACHFRDETASVTPAALQSEMTK